MLMRCGARMKHLTLTERVAELERELWEQRKKIAGLRK